MEKKRNKIYLEIVRIVAAALVIFNHQPIYTLFPYSDGLPQIVYIALSTITNINVPLFFLVSGALLLEKNDDYKTIFKKRMPRYILAIFVFNLISYSISSIQNSTSFNFIEYLKQTISNEVEWTQPYWFLYGYVGFLLMLPMLQKIANKLTEQDYRNILVIKLFFSSMLPIINILLFINGCDSISLCGSFSIPLITTDIIFLPLIGNYLENKKDIESLNKKQVLKYLFFFIIPIIFSIVLTKYEASLTGDYSNSFISKFSYLMALSFYVLIKKVVLSKKEFFSNNNEVTKIISKIGSYTFGIYLFDPILQKLFFWKYDAFVKPPLPTLFESMLWVIISMSAGSLLTTLFKKIPVFRKIL